MRASRTKKDLPSSLRWLASEGLESISRRFRDWTAEVERYLSRSPSFDVRTITVIGGSSNLDVATEFPPNVVLLGQVLLSDTPGAYIAATLYLDWIHADGGYRIRSIQGLTSGTRYTVTLLALGDFR